MFVYAFSIFFSWFYGSQYKFYRYNSSLLYVQCTKEKIYIKFCSFNFSILSANPLRKISMGTATPSLKLYLLHENAKYQRSFCHFQPQEGNWKGFCFQIKLHLYHLRQSRVTIRSSTLFKRVEEVHRHPLLAKMSARGVTKQVTTCCDNPLLFHHSILNQG